MKKRLLPPQGDRKAPPEHDEARQAILENLAQECLLRGLTFRATVVSITTHLRNEGHVAKRVEIEEALRRAEDKIREDFQNHDRLDRARSYRRLTKSTQGVYTELQMALRTTKDGPPVNVRAVAQLARVYTKLEAQLAQLMGWNEPERVRITVVNDAERLRKAFEGLDEERIAQLAARALRERDILERADRYLKAIPAAASIGDVDDGSA